MFLTTDKELKSSYIKGHFEPSPVMTLGTVIRIPFRMTEYVIVSTNQPINLYGAGHAAHSALVVEAVRVYPVDIKRGVMADLAYCELYELESGDNWEVVDKPGYDPRQILDHMKQIERDRKEQAAKNIEERITGLRKVLADAESELERVRTEPQN